MTNTRAEKKKRRIFTRSVLRKLSSFSLPSHPSPLLPPRSSCRYSLSLVPSLPLFIFHVLGRWGGRESGRGEREEDGGWRKESVSTFTVYPLCPYVSWRLPFFLFWYCYLTQTSVVYFHSFLVCCFVCSRVTLYRPLQHALRSLPRSFKFFMPFPLFFTFLAFIFILCLYVMLSPFLPPPAKILTSLSFTSHLFLSLAVPCSFFNFSFLPFLPGVLYNFSVILATPSTNLGFVSVTPFLFSSSLLFRLVYLTLRLSFLTSLPLSPFPFPLNRLVSLSLPSSSVCWKLRLLALILRVARQSPNRTTSHKSHNDPTQDFDLAQIDDFTESKATSREASEWPTRKPPQ